MRHAIELRVVIPPLLLAAALTACESSESGLLSCGTEVCGPRQECDRSSNDEPTCVCEPGYVGEACDVCASGYRRTADRLCVLIAIDCDDNPEICGTHGRCAPTGTPESGDDFCDCDDHYAGRLCEQCDDGYQDNDFNETCEPDCSTADLDCPGARICSDDSGLPLCTCLDGTTGDDCEFCALGFRSNESRCVPTCAALGLVCEANEYCSDEGDVAECRCLPGYAGATCSTCDEGYDDSLREGECLPTCEVAELSCGDHSNCADDVGFAYCQCDVGWAGVTCDECAVGHEGESCSDCSDGYLRIGDDSCESDCMVSGCPEGQHCANQAGVLGCVCDLGYTGDDCSDCDVGFAADGNGHCTAAVSSSFTLVGGALVEGTESLVAINPANAAVDPLRTFARSGIAYDPASQTLFVATAEEVGSLDLNSNEVTTIASLAQGAGGAALVFDLDLGTLVSVDASGQLASIDDGTSTVIGATELIVADLAYDSAGTRLLAATTGDAPELYELALADASASKLGDLPSGTTGITYTATGELIALQAIALSSGDARIETCRRAISNLGIEGYERAAGTAIEPTSATLSVTLDNQRSAGVELVALGLSGADSRRSVAVEGDNPDAVFCIATESEATDVTVAASARFRTLIYYSSSGDLDLVVESGLPVPQTPTILVGPGASIAASDHPAVREYSASEWEDRRLPTGDITDVLGAGALLELDPTDASVLATIPLDPGIVPSGTLAPWIP